MHHLQVQAPRAPRVPAAPAPRRRPAAVRAGAAALLSSSLLLALPLSATAALPGCDVGSDADCSHDFKLPSGGVFTLALHSLCNPTADYVINDGLGHIYSAQICGTARKQCLPTSWQNQYDYGHVVQTWGDRPSCNVSFPECVDTETLAPTCCSEPCQVIAVQKPTYLMIAPGDASQGFELFYMGETPTGSDPYQCDLDPSGKPFPRTTHMQFLCDWSVDGYARLFDVAQNKTDDCDYTLRFKTARACVGAAPLSGGWIFDIIVVVSVAVYYFGACFVTWRMKGIWALPATHLAYIEACNLLVLEGVLFALNRCRKPRREALDALLTKEGGGAGGLAATGGAYNASSSSRSGGGEDLAPAKSLSSSTASGGSYGSTKANAFTDL